MFKIHDMLTLKGKTLKGKNRVREHGENWVVLKVRDSVLFDQRAGPWLRVAPQSAPSLGQSRWVHATADDNFTISSRRDIGEE
jgi:hypothetical protein